MVDLMAPETVTVPTSGLESIIGHTSSLTDHIREISGIVSTMAETRGDQVPTNRGSADNRLFAEIARFVPTIFLRCLGITSLELEWASLYAPGTRKGVTRGIRALVAMNIIKPMKETGPIKVSAPPVLDLKQICVSFYALVHYPELKLPLSIAGLAEATQRRLITTIEYNGTAISDNPWMCFHIFKTIEDTSVEGSGVARRLYTYLMDLSLSPQNQFGDDGEHIIEIVETPEEFRVFVRRSIWLQRCSVYDEGDKEEFFTPKVSLTLPLTVDLGGEGAVVYLLQIGCKERVVPEDELFRINAILSGARGILEMILQRANEQILTVTEQAKRLKSELVRLYYHNANTFATSIKGYAEMLKVRELEDRKGFVHQVADVIVKAVVGIENTLKLLKQVALIEPSLKAVSIDDAVAQIVKAAEGNCREQLVVTLLEKRLAEGSLEGKDGDLIKSLQEDMENRFRIELVVRPLSEDGPVGREVFPKLLELQGTAAAFVEVAVTNAFQACVEQNFLDDPDNVMVIKVVISLEEHEGIVFGRVKVVDSLPKGMDERVMKLIKDPAVTQVHSERGMGIALVNFRQVSEILMDDLPSDVRFFLQNGDEGLPGCSVGISFPVADRIENP